MLEITRYYVINSKNEILYSSCDFWRCEYYISVSVFSNLCIIDPYHTIRSGALL